MNYIKEVLLHIEIIEQSSGQVNPLHKQQLQNSKASILSIVDHLQKQIRELQGELGVMQAIKREGN